MIEVEHSPFARAWAQRHRIAARPDQPGLFLALAPMDGITDWVYRDLLTDLGNGDSGISLCVSEFVRVTRRCVAPQVLRRHCPELDTGGRTRAGVEVFVQILGGDPEPMADSAALAADMGAPGIDINFGCPAKTVNNHDGGATILKTPQRVEKIVAAVRKATPSAIPVSVKIRLGWADASALVDIAKAAEAGGGAWLTVHARTRLQLYRPPVDWVALSRAREATRFPIVANGDLFSVEALQACARQSGCHAFMIGRGSMGRPWLFRQARGHDEPEYEPRRFRALLIEYARRLLAGGAPEKVSLGRVEQWLRLGAPAFEDIERLFTVVKVQRELAEGLALLDSDCPASPATLRGPATASRSAAPVPAPAP